MWEGIPKSSDIEPGKKLLTLTPIFHCFLLSSQLKMFTHKSSQMVMLIKAITKICVAFRAIQILQNSGSNHFIHI